MNHPKENPQRKFTYADYLTWPEDERWELIDGEPFDMTPAPSVDHQFIVGRLHRFFDEFLEGKTCHAYVAPFDVRVPKGDEADGEIDTVVQPDVVVICDEDHLDQRGLRGAPDLAVEVLSPSTASKDQIRKRRLYERSGVKEFWVVHPTDRMVMISRRTTRGVFGKTEYFEADAKIKVGLFPGLVIDLNRVFPPAPKREVRESPRKYLARKTSNPSASR
ncbi:MAG: Uma2 family endonuclease [Candidatus Riflebacteria bacterium]|nr:Uma2 family endonuclease [Candidatus Riflebacteria bacterium]